MRATMNTVDRLADDAGIEDRFLSDWSGLHVGRPARVFRPTSTEEVAAIVRQCHQEKRRITVQGGLTGVAGGAVPSEGDVVINLERMNRIEDIDALEGIMQVQAGAVLQEVQEAALARGWMFAIDLGARGSCQIGGNAATNAGGIRVVRYGPMRDSVLGVEAVLADGSIVSSLTRLVKNSTGIDPRHLLIGSEGTLGIITRLTLRLHPPLQDMAVAWVSTDHFDALPLQDILAAASDKLTALAVTQRSPLLPDVPTLEEAMGIMGNEDLVTWYGLLPAATPAESQKQLERAAFATLEQPGMRDKFATSGTDLVAMPSREFAARMERGSARFQAVIQRLKLTV